MKQMVKTKKFIATLVAVLLIVPFAFLLSACGANEDIIEVSTYAELSEALGGKYDVVKLTKDIDVEDTLAVTREMTLDLNGHKLYNTQDIWNDNDWSIIEVGKDGNLTITGNGKIDAKENDCYAVDVAYGGKLTIEDGEFIGNISAVYVFEGSAEIKGGKYSIKQLNDNGVESAYGCTINVYNQNQDANKASVSITGGVFVNFNPTDKTQNAHDNLVPEGYKAVLVEGSTTDYQIVKA